MPLIGPNLEFPIHAREVTRAVRASFTNLLASAGANPVEMQSIIEHVGLNKNLAWKLSKIAAADDPATVIKQMPGEAGLKIFFNLMQRGRRDPALLDRARQAIVEFHKLIETHSGDRETLAIMGNELSSAGRQKRDEQHRKQLFLGASHVWGARARVNLKIGILGPSAIQPPNDAGFVTNIDVCSVSGLIDFRRLRPDVRWVMALRKRFHDQTPDDAIPTEPVDPRFADENVAPLMGDFCSSPLPELHRFVDGSLNKFELVEGRVGNTGAITTVIGTIHRNIPFGAIPGADWGGSISSSDTPAELLISDHIVHQSLTYAIPGTVELHSQLHHTSMLPNERTRLPMTEVMEDLGKDPRVLPAREFPDHLPLIQALFDRMGWNPAEFHTFRLRIAYPACPAWVLTKYPLPIPTPPLA